MKQVLQLVEKFEF